MVETPPSPEDVIDQLGPYRLIEALGEGLQGRVYRARDGETGDEVAVKVLPAAAYAQRWRVRREIHTLGAVRHPNVIRILEHGEADEQLWYAMELVEGPDLVAYGRGQGPNASPGPLSSERLPGVLASFQAVAGALSYLHGEGVVHRDLKPSNVLVTGSGANARPVVLDLGLAERWSGPLRRERLGGVGHSGSLAFMAPEQLRGEPVDARADLFSLGCLLYATLAGRLPFASIRDVLAVGAEPEPPRLADGPLAPELADLVLGLLASDRRRRPQGADIVAAVLADHVSSGTTRKAGASSSPAPGSPTLFRSGLVGRSALADALAGRIAESLAACSGALVAIVGDSGMGKTRLVNETLRRLGDGWGRVVAGECRDGAAALAPLTGALSALDRRGVETPDEELAESLSRLARLVPELRAWERAAASRLVTSADEAGRAVSRALVVAFEWLTRERPLLLAVDDLQWADELTLGWLAESLASGWLTRHPLVVLATVRSDVSAEHVARLLDHASTRKLALSRLDDTQVGEMLGEMLGGDAPEGMVRHLAEVAAGNPLFVSEYTRAAVERRLLRREVNGGRARWRWERPGTGAEPLPTSVEALIADRIGRLPAAARAVAEAVSVLRPAAAMALLREVADADDADLLEAVQALSIAGVVIEDAAGDLRFDHQRVEDGVYKAMVATRRRALHRRAATALERRGGPPSERSSSTVARHWELGGEPDRARPHYLAAARAAAAGYALSRSRTLYERYLALAGEPGAERAAARVELGRDVLFVIGETDEAEASLRAALRDAEQVGADDAAADALFGLGRLMHLSGRFDEAEEALRRAAAPAERLERTRLMAAVAVQLGRNHLKRFEIDEAREATRRALVLHQQLDDPGGEADAFVNLALLEQTRLNSEGTQLLELARRGYAKVGDRLEVARTHLRLGNCAFFSQQWSEAAAQYEAALEVARAVGDRALTGAALGNLGNIYRTLGRYQQAASNYREAARIARDVGNLPNESVALTQVSTIERRLGRLAESVELLEQAAALKTELGDHEGHVRTMLELVWVCVVWGRLDRAEASLQQARRNLEAVSPGVRARLELAEGLLGLAQGEVSISMDKLRRALDLMASDTWTLTLVMGQTVLAQAHIQIGDLDAAGRVLGEAQALAAKAADPFWGSQVDLGVSRWCRFAGEIERARAHATRARRTFDRLGAVMGVAVALCELGHIALIEGQSARDWLERARATASDVELGPSSGVAAATVRLQAAEDATREGRDLVAGECRESVHPALHGGRAGG